MIEQKEEDRIQSMIIKDRLVKRIRTDGPITFAQFTQECLYGENGFFSTRRAGMDQTTSFLKSTTSPEKNPIFAQAITAIIRGSWEEMGKPDRFDIVEMGAGTGVFARDLIETTRRNYPDFYEHMFYNIVEISPSLISLQRSNVDDEKVSWIYGSAVDVPLRNVEGVFLSNELVDNFLFHRIISESGRLREIYVGEENGKLVEVRGKPSEDFRGHLRKIGTQPENDVEIYICLDAVKWMKNVAKSLRRGYVITIDYGARAEVLHSKKSVLHKLAVGTVNYSLPGRNEKHIFDWVGGIDITTPVDFTALLKTGESYGLRGEMLTQKDFLVRAGVLDQVAARLLLNDRSTMNNIDQIRALFTTHLVLLQAKGDVAK